MKNSELKGTLRILGLIPVLFFLVFYGSRPDIRAKT
jgi:hypothetical protein